MTSPAGIDAAAFERLRNQWISQPEGPDPARVVARLGAVQAQDFGAAKWALALRMRRPVTDADLERAFNDGRILRTHVLRPTWHFVTPGDIGWLLKLTAPRVHRGLTYGNRVLELDVKLRTRAAALFERALGDGAHLTRGELADVLARRGIAVKGVRLALLTIFAELEGVMCSGPKRGAQHTYALLATRAPAGKRLAGDEALAELAKRFFSSHGPATVRDFVWWSGLTVTDARRGIGAGRITRVALGGREFWSGRTGDRSRDANVHLLPVYDEYLVAYRDHDAVPRPPARWGILPQAVVAAGFVAGTWRPQRGRTAATVDVRLLKPLTTAQRRALARTVKRYGQFLGTNASLSIA